MHNLRFLHSESFPRSDGEDLCLNFDNTNAKKDNLTSSPFANLE